MSLYEYVGERIRALRNEYGEGKGISQELLGKALNVTANTVSRWETATYQPSLEDLDKMGRFFGVSILQFFPSEASQEVGTEALLRAAKGLPESDLEELRRYAEYRKARHFMGQHGERRPGRKRQNGK